MPVSDPALFAPITVMFLRTGWERLQNKNPFLWFGGCPHEVCIARRFLSRVVYILYLQFSSIHINYLQIRDDQSNLRVVGIAL